MRLLLLALVVSLFGGCATGVLLGGGKGGETTASRPNDADMHITAEVSRRLVNDPQIPAMDIHVQTQQGVVTLTGWVPNGGVAARAERIARGVPGVKGVQNRLRLKQ